MRMAVAFDMAEFRAVGIAERIGEREQQIVLHIGVGILVDGDGSCGVRAVHGT